MVPLFAALRFARVKRAFGPEARVAAALRRIGSAGISVAGSYYLLVALTRAS